MGLNNSGQGDTVQMILQQQSILGMGSIDPATGQLSSIPEFLRPSDSYIAPSSGFFFGHILQTPPILSLLPSEAIRSKLMNRYFEAVHPVAPCGHRPSFEAVFRSFEEDIRYNIEPRASVQAVVFAAWFSATLSLPAEDVPMSYGVNRDDLLNKMKLGAESALSKAHFIRTTKVETLQALVMYLVSTGCPPRERSANTTRRSPCAATKSPAPTPSSPAPPSASRSAWASTATASSTA